MYGDVDGIHVDHISRFFVRFPQLHLVLRLLVHKQCQRTLSRLISLVN